MYIYTTKPQFNETDQLGHISHTTYPKWFESAREPLFKIFHPSLDVNTWPLIIASMKIDYLAQCYWGTPVDLHTYIEKIGNSSCHLVHEAWQDGKVVARGFYVMVYFNFETEKSMPITDEIRQGLQKYLKTDG